MVNGGIKAVSGARLAAGAQARAPAAGGGGFSLSAAGGAETAEGPRAPAPAAGLAGLDALLALQEEAPLGERRRRAVRRAGRLLDVLDDLKLALLGGGGAEGVLEGLRRTLAEERPDAEDPRLAALLDEIDVRAAVEMAKREKAGF